MRIAFLFANLLIGSLAFASTDLTMGLRQQNAYLVDASAQSCANKMATRLDSSTPISYDVSASHFGFSGLDLQWNHPTDTAHIVAIKINFSDANVNYSCTIAAEELDGIFFNYTGLISWNGAMAPQTSISSQCPLRCGYVLLKDHSKNFTSDGTMTLMGFQRSPTGDETPLKASAPVKLHKM
ncbi:hypothetical protein [Bdellovibrio sp. HCB337]|uniref:hypothetical protein n=1 Tax=Bdellovibrio sp. HCB337 TaxID=3394358 RepID=UPI0039A59D41